MASADVKRTIDAVWRIESARLIAGLARFVRDVGLAEDLAQEALVAALEQWPQAGVPDNPGAWLMATAKHRAIDRLRRADVHRRKTEELGRDLERRGEADMPDLSAEVADPFDDDVLRLIFTACHPVLSLEARVALTLRLLAGLTTREIARAYLVPEATVQQRIVRAKRTLSAARVPIEVPERGELPERLSSVLEAIYLIFNEGYSATAGDKWLRPELLEEALRLGRMLAALLPGEPEVHGLSALMELQASRARARLGPDGEPILLLDQDRSRWDWMLVGRGLAALERAYAAGGAVGTYTLQAAIAACHARPDGGGDRLGEHRRHLRWPRRGRAVAGGGAEPRGRGRYGVRPRSGAATRRRTGRRARPEQLSPPADGARRPAGEAGPDRRYAQRIRARPHAHPERPRALRAPAAHRGLLGACVGSASSASTENLSESVGTQSN
ncbi:MAG: polymerase subunit sigma-24 [Conexibacter sp.]|nr:polymerase subunit sigma-24 [Conexibacter sp.]